MLRKNSLDIGMILGGNTSRSANQDLRKWPVSKTGWKVGIRYVGVSLSCQLRSILMLLTDDLILQLCVEDTDELFKPAVS